MYTHQITIELSDDIVHEYSILEWENILLRDSIIDRDQLPLSYGAIAEIIANELYKYRHFMHYTVNDWRCTEHTTFTNDNGFTTNTKIKPAMTLPSLPSVTLPAELEDPLGTMVIGIANYRNDPKRRF